MREQGEGPEQLQKLFLNVEGLFVATGVNDILAGVFFKTGFFFGRQGTDDAGGTAQREMSGGNPRPRRHEGSRPDQDAFPDHRAAQQNRSHADQRAIAHPARVKNRPMPHGHIFSNHRLYPLVGVHDGVVLNVGSVPHHDPLNVAPQHSPRPNGHSRAELNISDHLRRWVNKGG